ncbi:MAG: hypothetical protein B6D64_09690 [Bacteroidetes bacterium 4484_276]|nr:MAG: hypothetical protein B6D64_09690 [Bacteroidetes bacterium 4484_276]OYT12772.1 MAG: hypothetical protein B6I19_08590 [Bacteroidetes bacterium 4572_114]
MTKYINASRPALRLIMISLLISCTNSSDSRLSIDTSDIKIKPVEIKRYEKALFTIDQGSLKQGLKKISTQFPVFLDVDLDDTLNLIRLHEFITNPLNVELYNKTTSKYPNLTIYNQQFTEAFKRFKYFFPEKSLPQIFSYVSGLLYEMPIQFISGDMIIALDMYLGKSLEAYRRLGLPLYKIDRMNENFIVRDGVYELYYYHFLKKPGKNVLEKMIAEGKHLYFLDAMLPEIDDHIKIGYTQDQLKWCEENEKNIWAFIIENELLYSSNTKTLRNFFTDGPFTHDFSKESPARIGEWIGWQIVRSYMKKHPGLPLEQLFMEEDAQAVLMKSVYKP